MRNAAEGTPLAAIPDTIPVREVRWQPCFRVISSRYPTIHLFERLSDPQDWDTLYALESLTNARLREEAGELARVPPEDRLSGPGSTVIMAPFTHLDPSGSRFTDGTFGAFYAAASLATSVAETRHHRERFLRATAQGPIELDMRTYLADVEARFHDIRGLRPSLSAIYDPDSYVSSQVFGRELRLGGSNGIAFDSVRHAGGQCLAVFRPRLVRNLRQGAHLRYVWDGNSISRVYELRLLEH
ncbi:MAG TPA: RES family NAD+ phosphorylase [Steroidobacteraceae bacterium]|nr:RES family NAD+ phosphorylase [Steroidobacteraceae bacterium]